MLLLISPAMGSFAECMAERLPQARPILTARSSCNSCSQTLGILELVPIASWIALGGKCRHCGHAIPRRHLMAELTAVAVTAWAVAVMSGWLLWVTAALGWSLLALALMDIYFLILADIVVWPLLASGLLISSIISSEAALASVLGILAGGGFAYLLKVAYRALRGREGIGLGDVKFLAAAGAWLGWHGLPSALLIGAIGGLVGALVLAASGSPISPALRIPFGAFLAGGTWVVWLHGPIVLGN
jgi:leader peptidase (prepilin peptidase)/N-methyltransferase